MSDATHAQFDAPHDPAPAEDLDQTALAMLDVLVNRLSDNLDHPEVWALLGELRGDAGMPTLLHTLRAARPRVGDPGIGHNLDVIEALIIALREDKATGIARLKALEQRDPASPLTAGASFYADRIDDPQRTADLSARFCSSPFIKFETLVDGTVAPCCSIWTQHRLGHLDRSGFEEIWNSPDAQEMRASILDGSYRHCHKQRCTLILEDSLPLRDEVTDPGLRAILDGKLTRLETLPRWLFLAHDPTCNLACPSCRAGLEIADADQQARFDVIMDRVLRPMLDNGDDMTVSVSGQGDPWSSHHYRGILRHLADSERQVNLQIYTNALLMSERRWAEHVGLARHNPRVDVSIDAASPWVYEHVRRPGKWATLIENLRFIAGQHKAGVFHAFSLNATVQLDNFQELPALVALAEELDADELRLYMIQNTGTHLSNSYARANVAGAEHPLHLAFLETLRDPCLAGAKVHMYDVGTWRAIALERTLPSDALGQHWSRDDAIAAIGEHIQANDFITAAALCAAVRIRLPGDVNILQAEGAIYDHLGFVRQGNWRRAMAGA